MLTPLQQHAQSISGTIINFLTALSLVNDGVREVLPFIRYIAQFMDFEFNNIRAQDQGRGVVCAATWSALFSAIFCISSEWPTPQDHACSYGATSSQNKDSC